jgi:hypothetical protein
MNASSDRLRVKMDLARAAFTKGDAEQKMPPPFAGGGTFPQTSHVPLDPISLRRFQGVPEG